MILDSVKYNPMAEMLEIEGWGIFKEGEDVKFGIKYNDQIKWIAKVIRKERADVQATISEHLEKPGFYCEIPMTMPELVETKKARFVRDINGDQETVLLYKKEELYQEAMGGGIDITVDEKRCVGTYLVIQGWVMSYGGPYQIEVFDDMNQPVECVIRREVRKDVWEIFPDRVEKENEVGFVLRLPEEQMSKNGLTIRFFNQYGGKNKHVTRKDFPTREPYIARLWEATKPSTWRVSLRCLRTQGKKYLKEHLHSKIHHQREIYNEWFVANGIKTSELQHQKGIVFPYHPTISIAIPLYNTPLDFLEAIIESVCKQSYPYWQLCLADGSSNDEAENYINKKYGDNPKVVYKRLTDNAGISENTNRAIEMATGEFLMFSDHDDLIEPDALFEIVKALNESDQVDAVYTDEDKITMSGDELYDPQFKPDFNWRMIETNNYICHIFVVRRTIVDKVGMLRSEFDGAQDYDMVLRCCEEAREVRHVAKPLYHWRAHPNSTAGNPDSKNYAYVAGKNAVQAHFDRLGIKAKVEQTDAYGRYRTFFEIEGNPKVSIIIPNKDHIEDLKQCIEAVVDKTQYSNYEILVVENNSVEAKTKTGYQEILDQYSCVRLLNWNKPFNYAAINNYAAKEASGEYLLFLNNDITVINEDWLTELVAEMMQKDVGIVGAKLYYPDNTIQHAGVVIGLGGPAGHAFYGLDRRDVGYAYRTKTTQDVSAVTAACMLMRKSVFDEIKGFDEQFVVAFNDVDLCLRTIENGYRVIFTPYAEAYHAESKTRGKESGANRKRFKNEKKIFCKRWRQILKDGDPYFNKNLSTINERVGIRL